MVSMAGQYRDLTYTTPTTTTTSPSTSTAATTTTGTGTTTSTAGTTTTGTGTTSTAATTSTTTSTVAPTTTTNAPANCPAGENEFVFTYKSDGYPEETKWWLKERASGSWVTLHSIGYGSITGDTTKIYCISASTSRLRFRIFDSIGDGIFAPGGFSISLNSAVIESAFNNEFGGFSRVTVTFNNVPSGNRLPKLDDIETENSKPSLEDAEENKYRKINGLSPLCLMGDKNDPCEFDDDCCSGACKGSGKCYK